MASRNFCGPFVAVHAQRHHGRRGCFDLVVAGEAATLDGEVRDLWFPCCNQGAEWTRWCPQCVEQVTGQPLKAPRVGQGLPLLSKCPIGFALEDAP